MEKESLFLELPDILISSIIDKYIDDIYKSDDTTKVGMHSAMLEYQLKSLNDKNSYKYTAIKFYNIVVDKSKTFKGKTNIITVFSLLEEKIKNPEFSEIFSRLKNLVLSDPSLVGIKSKKKLEDEPQEVKMNLFKWTIVIVIVIVVILFFIFVVLK